MYILLKNATINNHFQLIFNICMPSINESTSSINGDSTIVVCKQIQPAKLLSNPGKYAFDEYEVADKYKRHHGHQYNSHCPVFYHIIPVSYDDINNMYNNKLAKKNFKQDLIDYITSHMYFK